MDRLEELYHLYSAYEKKARDVREKAPRFAGVLGLGEDPRKHECHVTFYEDVERWVQTFVRNDPDRESVVRAARWILMAADAHRNTDIFGYLYASQKHAEDLILRLSREDSLALAREYESAYPVAERLPVQQTIHRLLWKQAGTDPAREKSWLRRIFPKA